MDIPKQSGLIGGCRKCSPAAPTIWIEPSFRAVFSHVRLCSHVRAVFPNKGFAPDFDFSPRLHLSATVSLRSPRYENSGASTQARGTLSSSPELL